MGESSLNSSPESESSANSRSSRRKQTINIGRWSAAEDARLREAVVRHGTRWVIVAPEVGTRNSEQCAKRWNDNLNPSLDHSFWSVEEDKLLLHLVTIYGHNWKLMTEGSFQSRPPLALKNRHSLLMRRQKRQNKRQLQASAKTSGNDAMAILTPPSEPQVPHNVNLDLGGSILSSISLPVQEPMGTVSYCSLGSGSLMPFDGDIGMGGQFPTTALANQQDSQGKNDHCSNPLATVADVGDINSYNHQQGQIGAYTGWNRQQICDSIDFDSLFDGADMSFRLGGVSHDMTDLERTPKPERNKEKATEISVTCSRSRLRAMVCHAFEGAMRETRGLSEEDQVTVTLRLKR